MENNNLSKHVYFIPLDWVIKADAEIRGRFSLDTLAKTRLLEQAKNEGIESLIVTSTCNRTEIYGFAEHLFN
jgi:glutamyl-tRNA reductase